tara:strand:- start:491 stop:712 length:222 start_codon:yes stop_codon:yes gene_type:complete
MDKLVIYSRDGCVYCDMAINLALSKGIDTQIKKLGADYTVEDFTSKFPYAKTVPQIILNGEHIGGYQDLKDTL